MTVSVRFITDPACDASWSVEPELRRLSVEFGEQVRFTYVMGGLAREFDPGGNAGRIVEWLRRSDASGMPLDPLLWSEGPLGSSYPACMAVKAAADQDRAGEMLRALREGIFCFRRKLDNTEALVEEARRAGLDIERFRIDLASHAIVEAFAADLEEARAVPDITLPALRFGEGEWLLGPQPYHTYREATIAAGAEPSGERPPDVSDALRRFGRMATAEVERVCELQGPRAEAELWSLALDWKARPTRVLTGWLWEPA